MSGYRPERVAEQIHKEVSQLLTHGVKDPRVALVIVTGVNVTVTSVPIGLVSEVP